MATGGATGDGFWARAGVYGEVAFQMALPLIRVPAAARGTVRAGVRVPEEDGEELVAGSTVEVAEGRKPACEIA